MPSPHLHLASLLLLTPGLGARCSTQDTTIQCTPVAAVPSSFPVNFAQLRWMTQADKRDQQPERLTPPATLEVVRFRPE